MFNFQIYCLKTAKILFGLLLIFSLTGCDGLFSEDNWDFDSECDEDTTDVDFKQVAYWIEDDPENFEDISDNEIDYGQMTHLIFGYLAIDDDGDIEDIDDDSGFEGAIADAQDEGVEVFISIGGVGYSDEFETIAGDSDLIDDFIDNVVDLVDEYDLDGIDISWRYPDDDDEGELFEDLIEELYEELDDQGVDLSIEVVSGLDEEEDYADVIDSDVFDYVDFVNIRAYNTNNDDGESDDDDLYLTTDDMLDVIDYWTDRCLIQNKLVVGIPVYGIAPDNSDATEDYADIVDEKSDESTFACDDDDKASIDGDYYYYNAIPTVYEKTEYADTYAGGVMLMSLDQDYNTDADYSLLNAVDLALDGDDTVCD